MLREEKNDAGASACELYWVVRSGFNLLPFNYDIPTSDLSNYPSATEPEAEEHMYNDDHIFLLFDDRANENSNQQSGSTRSTSHCGTA